MNTTTTLSKFNIILFDDFETLDAFGPAEVIGRLPHLYQLEYFSFNGGLVTSKQNIKISTLPITEIDKSGVLLIPGGQGTRSLINDVSVIHSIKILSLAARYVLTVCTGSALLAKTQLLDGKHATTNKKAFEWVCAQGINVQWKKQARWVNDEKFYTASGVSAGIDMTLGFVSDIHGNQLAEDIAQHIEYIWNKDKNNDPFSV